MPRRLLGYWPEALALVVFGPIGIAAFDRTPPQVRLSGYITDHNYDLPVNEVRIGSTFDVHWRATAHARNCPGQVQVEITQTVGSATLIAPVQLKRDVFNPPIGAKEFQPDPWPVPKWAVAGDATYRVSTFWQCNWLQRAVPSLSIYQVGPDIHFKIMPQTLSER